MRRPDILTCFAIKNRRETLLLKIAEKDILFRARLRNAVDPRMLACRIEIAHEEGGTQLTGFVQLRQTEACVRGLAAEIFGEKNLDIKLKVLQKSTPAFAVVKGPVADVWLTPDASDREKLQTQALCGAVIRTWHREGKFTFVQLPDGYVGYCPTAQLERVSVEDYLRWKNGPRAVTLDSLAGPDYVIPAGSRLNYEDGKLLLPNGKTLAPPKSFIRVSNPSDPKFVKRLRRRAEIFMPSPYLWGGKSEIGIDCSGFTQTLMLQEGIFLPRDASMQCHVGEIVGYLKDLADLLPGDIMFFMNDKGYVFHVGIYLGENQYMHSAGATGPTVSSVLEGGENFMTRYHGTFCYARRVFV